MRILVVTTQVPFIRGGAEIHAEGLVNSLLQFNHQAELVSLPFKDYPIEKILDYMLINRLQDLSEFSGKAIDRIITLKFPTYLIPHPQKIIWLLHQYREAYELWDTEYSPLSQSALGWQVRENIIKADQKAFKEAKAIFSNSLNVANRLKTFNDFQATPLYHPPQNAEAFYTAEEKGYFFFPSRLTGIKRQELVIQALAKTSNAVKVIFAGKPDQETYLQELINLAKQLGVYQQIKFLGGINQKELIQYYAESLAVIFPPFQEDYGYVTLEAMLSAKPVLTCCDSGGPLEFVSDQKTGLIAESNPLSLAAAMDRIWDNRTWAKSLGQAGLSYYKAQNITWSNVIEKLTR